ncbi:hypothetical protein BKA58DRAFT_116102 [Alternaria rosae]|uniref:uncharacterized protein n=1 Tax=Alternaria rosae TaxID=1187941 RepID=UPI001E8D9552|nr:uncharacterized protein BKA58DRAFT_116102 [Alternaria rosae]KAH6875119.1 hypothetical protein BKA58DRAFT_116102 [Alternaria rosae]
MLLRHAASSLSFSRLSRMFSFVTSSKMLLPIHVSFPFYMFISRLVSFPTPSVEPLHNLTVIVTTVSSPLWIAPSLRGPTPPSRPASPRRYSTPRSPRPFSTAHPFLGDSSINDQRYKGTWGGVLPSSHSDRIAQRSTTSYLSCFLCFSRDATIGLSFISSLRRSFAVCWLRPFSVFTFASAGFHSFFLNIA